MRTNILIQIVTAVFIFLCFLSIGNGIDRTNKKLEEMEKMDEWHLQSHQYVITLQDDDWVEVRHADGSIVGQGQVKVDSTSELGKLFIKDNE